MNALAEVLGIGRGERVCIVGCGGKTSLMYALAQAYRESGVLMTTTTHILMPPEREFDAYFMGGEPPAKVYRGVYLLGVPSDVSGKLKSLPEDTLCRWAQEFSLVLMEGDGSRGLPLKGWAEDEPVVPSWTTLTVSVVTLWPVGRNLTEDVVFAPERFCSLTGAKPGELVTLEHITRMIAAPSGMFRNARGRKLLFINQVEDDASWQAAQELARLLAGAGLDGIAAGSAQTGYGRKISQERA